MSPDARTTALHLTAVTKLGERLRLTAVALRAQVTEELQVGDRLTVTLDGVRISQVTCKAGAVSTRVSDRAALLAWVRQWYPTEVETLTTSQVRPAFVEKILAWAKTAGEPVDPSSGDLIPGVEVHQGEPTIAVTPTKEADAAIAAAWASGQLPLPSQILQLPTTP